MWGVGGGTGLWVKGQWVWVLRGDRAVGKRAVGVGAVGVGFWQCDRAVWQGSGCGVLAV